MKQVLSTAILIMLTMGYTVVNAQEHLEIRKKFRIYSAGGWDYIAVGPDGNLYVSNRSQVNIINKNSGDSVSVIPNTQGVHGIAFVPGQKKGYTSNGKSNNVTVFDLASHRQIGMIPTGENPDAIFYENSSGKIITCNGHSKDLSIIDPSSDQVIATINIGGKPEAAVCDGKGMVYVNIEDKSEIVAVNIKTKKVLHHWSLAPGEGPTGLAFDKETGRLFAGCDRLLVVLDVTSGKIITTLPIGEGCDGVVFDSSSKRIYTANGEGTLSVIREKSANDFVVEENVPTQKSARTLAIDDLTHTIYLPAAEFEPAAGPGKRPPVKPATFKVLVVK